MIVDSKNDVFGRILHLFLMPLHILKPIYSRTFKLIVDLKCIFHRFCIELAKQFNLERIIMHDDNIPYVYWHKEHQGYIQRNKTGASKLENIPLFTMFKQWESMFNNRTQTPEVPFTATQHGNPLQLQSFTGIHYHALTLSILCS